MSIHPAAIVEKGAQIAADVSIGPYCHIGAEVVLEEGVVLHSHVVIGGITTVGKGTEIFPFASLGLAPQDLKYRGEKSRLLIGERNVIREHVTINPGTAGDRMETRVGDGCLLMVGVHIGHDCVVGHRCILANNATLAGHVVLEDHVVIGGLSAVHQFVQIGAHAMIGGMSGIEGDIPPFTSAMGERAKIAGLNLTGLKRRDFTREQMHTLRKAYQSLFHGDKPQEERTEQTAAAFADSADAMQMIAFLQSSARKRPLCKIAGD